MLTGERRMGLRHCRWNVDQCRLLSVKVSERKIWLSRDSSDLAECGTSSEEKTGGVLQAESGHYDRHQLAAGRVCHYDTSSDAESTYKSMTDRRRKYVVCARAMERGSTIKPKARHLWQDGHTWKALQWNKPHATSFLSKGLSHVESKTIVLTVDERGIIPRIQERERKREIKRR